MDKNNLNDYAICEVLFQWLLDNLEEGSTVLEFGSGKGTIELCKYFEVYSIEQAEEWLNVAPSNYIHAPIKDGWYDLDALVPNIPKSYDLLLVDGPHGTGNRSPLLDHWHLFDTTVPIVMDDTERPYERQFAIDTAVKLNKNVTFYDGIRKGFAIVD